MNYVQSKRGCPGVQGELQSKRGCPGVQGELQSKRGCPGANLICQPEISTI